MGRAGRYATAALLSALVAVVPGMSAAQRAELRALPIRILTVGDSLTAGYGGSDTQGYRRELGARLTAAGVPHVFTVRGGATVQDLRASVDSWLAADQPDVVLLESGTNNAAMPRMANFERDYIDLVNRILGWSATVRVGVAMVTYSNAPWSKALVDVNVAAIHASWWAVPAGRVVLADMSMIHVCQTFDGVHLRDAGYDSKARQWYRALTPMLGLPTLTYTDHYPTPVRRPGYERTLKVDC